MVETRDEITMVREQLAKARSKQEVAGKLVGDLVKELRSLQERNLNLMAEVDGLRSIGVQLHAAMGNYTKYYGPDELRAMERAAAVLFVKK